MGVFKKPFPISRVLEFKTAVLGDGQIVQLVKYLVGKSDADNRQPGRQRPEEHHKLKASQG